MWLYLSFLSALFLGFYEVAKKSSLNRNAVVPVLFLNTVFGSIIFLPFVGMSHFAPELMRTTVFYIPPASPHTHLLIFIKSMIALSSWIFNYFATKHLAMTIAGPVKATQPVVVLLGALLVFGEKLNLYQWIGVLLSVFSLYLLSATGRKEGIRFGHNKWIFYAVLSIIFGAISGLYDKYLMTRLDVMTVQVWFNVYQVFMMIPVLMLFWYPRRRQSTPFVWRWSIVFISIFLALADWVYFYALSFPDSMISIVSMIRRSSVLVTFAAGAFIYHEKNLKSKTFELILIMFGMFFLLLGTI